MKVGYKPVFQRDYRRIKNKKLIKALFDKIEQIENAKSVENITGLKLLRGYSTQYRILVKTDKYSYRIGATVRGNTK